ncbi:MAG: YjiH family protein [Mogibacterium sp.]|nr:YjiH family protein [Mogibacterium sp.]
MEKFTPVKLTTKNLLMFIIPACIGFLIYLTPMKIGGKFGMAIGLLLSWCSSKASGWSMQVAIILMTVTAIATLICKLTKPDFVMKSERLKKILVPSWVEVVIRLVGSALAIIVWFQLISEVIYSEDTGVVMLDLVASIMIWFVVASFFVPFLLDFGLMEFIGTLCRGVARPLLHIPGRSMIDVLTSFLGDQNLGIMLTDDQYSHGYYTAKEAVTISCCFSATGIAYWYIISTIVGVEGYFVQIVVTMFVTALLTTIIMCRIPPITLFPDTYYNNQAENKENDKPEDMSTFQFAVQLAVKKASTFQGLKAMAWRSIDFCSSIIFSVLPVVMIIGTVGLIIATYTPVFNWLGAPFGWFMNLLGIPDATAAAPATVSGFADVMIPSLLCGDITSELTKFIICVLSLIQIIYMSEVGPILLMSKIPVKFHHLVILFIEKTILAIPIIYICGMLFGIPR